MNYEGLLDGEIVFRNTCEARGCPTISIGPEMVWWHRAEPTVCDDAAAFGGRVRRIR